MGREGVEGEEKAYRWNSNPTVPLSHPPQTPTPTHLLVLFTLFNPLLSAPPPSSFLVHLCPCAISFETPPLHQCRTILLPDVVGVGRRSLTTGCGLGDVGGGRIRRSRLGCGRCLDGNSDNIPLHYDCNNTHTHTHTFSLCLVFQEMFGAAL